MPAPKPSDPYAPPAAGLDDESNSRAGPFPSLFSPRGRMGRLQLLSYGLVLSFIVSVIGLAVAIADVLLFAEPGSLPVLSAPYVLASISLVLWVIWCIKRCHDCSRSGWFAIASVIPFVNVVFLLVPGAKGGNEFGFAPPNRGRHWTLAVGAVALFVVIAIFIATDRTAWL